MIRIFNQKLSKTVLSALIVAGLFLPAARSHAQESFQSTIREIANRIGTLLMLRKNSELSPEEKLRQEITARKEAVRKIFDLTELEQSDLLSRLSGLENLNEQQEKMRTALTELVKENSNGLKEIRNRLDKADTLDDIKQLAADFKDWRTFVYNPKTEKVVAFTFVFQGKNILSVTDERLERVKNDLAEYQNSLKESDKEAEGLLAKAGTEIREAHELNGQARNIILIALNNSLFPFKNARINEKELARDIYDSKSFTEKSMQHIRKAYSIFLELGKITRSE